MNKLVDASVKLLNVGVTVYIAVSLAAAALILATWSILWAMMGPS